VCGVRTLGQLHKWLTGAAQLDNRLDGGPLPPPGGVWNAGPIRLTPCHGTTWDFKYRKVPQNQRN